MLFSIKNMYIVYRKTSYLLIKPSKNMSCLFVYRICSESAHIFGKKNAVIFSLFFSTDFKSYGYINFSKNYINDKL